MSRGRGKSCSRFRAVADLDEWAACWRLTMCGLRRSEIMGLTVGVLSILIVARSSIAHGRVALDGHRTATNDPKSQPPGEPFLWSRYNRAPLRSCGH